jgi:RNA polymerase sigma factor (sigma-70 family)
VSARLHDALGAIAERQMGNRNADELLANAISGDRAAWHEIVGKYQRLVVNTARKVGLSHSDADDVAQQTWLRLWEHGHQIRQPERLASWLVSTARREAIRLAGSSNRHVLCADLSGERSRVAAVIDTYPVEQEYDWPIQQALNRLPTRYRTLLRLLSSELELSYSEVAGKMGLPIGSIGPMRIRAIRMLEKTPEYISGRFARPAVSVS